MAGPVEEERDEARAVRMLVKRSVVATRGSSRVDGISQISRKTSGEEGVSKGDIVRLTLTLRRFGRLLNASVRRWTSQEVPRYRSLSSLSWLYTDQAFSNVSLLSPELRIYWMKYVLCLA